MSKAGDIEWTVSAGERLCREIFRICRCDSGGEGVGGAEEREGPGVAVGRAVERGGKGRFCVRTMEGTRYVSKRSRSHRG